MLSTEVNLSELHANCLKKDVKEISNIFGNICLKKSEITRLLA